MNPFDSAQLLGLMRRYLFCSICTVLIVILGAGLWLLRQDMHTLEIENRERSQQFAAMLSTLKSGPLIRIEAAKAQDIVHRIESNLVTEKKLEENLSYFYKIQPDAKEILTYLRPMNPEGSTDDNDYKLVPFSVQLSGTFDQVASYLLRLETGPRLAVIRTFSFRRQGINQPGLNVNIELRLLGKK